MAHSWVSELEACTLALEPGWICKQVALEVEGEAGMRVSWAGRSALEAEVGTEPVPAPEAAGRCGLEGARHRLYEVLEAAPEGPDRQASRWEEEEPVCCRFALVVACIGASACTLALEVHR